MTTRNTYNGSSESVPWGTSGETEGFGDQYARHVTKLYDASLLPLTGAAGTNDVVASVDPELPVGGLVNGMKFSITWPETNTGPMTLSINGDVPKAVTTATGEAMADGAVASGVRSVLEYLDGGFLVLTGVGSAGGGVSQEIFTSSGTWNKPGGVSGEELVRIQVWGAGGGGSGGSSGAGGGGGGYTEREFFMSELPSSVAVSIGAGGAIAGDGGSSSFGSLVQAGGGFAPYSSSLGGLGGNASTGGSWSGFNAFAGGMGGNDSNTVGGYAAFGGGGGGYRPGGAQGVSYLGGNGGAAGAAGVAPGGGGGGGGGVGARGELRVTIYG